MANIPEDRSGAPVEATEPSYDEAAVDRQIDRMVEQMGLVCRRGTSLTGRRGRWFALTRPCLCTRGARTTEPNTMDGYDYDRAQVALGRLCSATPNKGSTREDV